MHKILSYNYNQSKYEKSLIIHILILYLIFLSVHIINNNGNINIISNTNDINQTGSVVFTNNGDINYIASNDINIIASADKYKSTSESENISTSVYVGTNGADFSLSGGKNSSKERSTTYNNSIIQTNNGNISFTTGNDATFSGANIQAGNDLTLNIANNLTVESLQDTQYANSTGFNVGISFGTSKDRETQAKTGNSKGINFSSSSGYTDSSWVNNQTTLIANNNIDVNVKENTNIKGAITASGEYKTKIIKNDKGEEETVYELDDKGNRIFVDNNNLILNTNTLTYSNLQDFYTTEEQSTSVGLNLGKSPSEASYKGDKFNLDLLHTGENKKQTTYATIGNGNITIGNHTLQDNETINKDGTIIIISEDNKNNSLNRDTTKSQIITSDQITGSLDVSVSFDLRMLTESGRSEIKDDLKDFGKNTHLTLSDALETTYDLGGKYLNKGIDFINDSVSGLGLLGDGLQFVLSTIVGTSNYFFEDRSVLLNKNGETNDATSALNFYGNGIQNELDDVNKTVNLENTDTVARYNPESSVGADVVESGLGKLFNLLGLGGASRLSRLETQDFYDRKDMENANTVFHSQGTIVGVGALQLYADKYGDNSINNTQSFVFTGPAVNEWQIKDTIKGVGVNSKYVHDPLDPINYMTNIDKLPEGLGRFGIDAVNFTVNSTLEIFNVKRKSTKLMDFSKHTFIINDNYNKYLNLRNNNQIKPINNNTK